MKKLLVLLALASPAWASHNNIYDIHTDTLTIINAIVLPDGTVITSTSPFGGTGGASLSSTNTWTAGQTFGSSATVVGQLKVSSIKFADNTVQTTSAPASSLFIPAFTTGQSTGPTVGSLATSLDFNVSFALHRSNSNILITVFFGINGTTTGGVFNSSIFMDGVDTSGGAYLSQWTVPATNDKTTQSYSWVVQPGDSNTHVFEVYALRASGAGTAVFGAQNSMMTLQEILQ